MGILEILTLIYKNWGLLKFIFNLLQQGLTAIEISGKLSEYDAAQKKAQATGDTTDLENLFNHPNG